MCSWLLHCRLSRCKPDCLRYWHNYPCHSLQALHMEGQNLLLWHGCCICHGVSATSACSFSMNVLDDIACGDADASLQHLIQLYGLHSSTCNSQSRPTASSGKLRCDMCHVLLRITTTQVIVGLTVIANDVVRASLHVCPAFMHRMAI